MRFEDFKEAVKEKIKGAIGTNCKVALNDVTKNNGVVLCGLTVQSAESNISPTIYLNSYYTAFEDGRCRLDEIADDILKVYAKNKIDQQIDASIFTDYSRCRDTLAYKLINTEKNKELLKCIPHMEFLDLSIVFESILPGEYEGRASILIRNEHMQAWGITQDRLSEDAFHNAPLVNKYILSSLEAALQGIFMIAEPGDDYIPLFILSNEKHANGAACMLYPEVLKNFSEKIGRNIYIIPSSVHEVLLMPEADRMNAELIREMVREVNDTTVDAEQILSYSVYFYNRSTDEITMPA